MMFNFSLKIQAKIETPYRYFSGFPPQCSPLKPHEETKRVPQLATRSIIMDGVRMALEGF